MDSNIFYSIKDKKFTNKVDALRYASTFSENECRPFDVKFHFYDSIWDNFNRDILGKISLKEIYRQRAQDIRDRYDYLVLYYTGGSDSHTILETFLENNIPLDEVAVKWPKKLPGSSLYVPNKIDESARNFVSEWDFVIENELKKLRSSHPEIKITILDYVEDIPHNYYTDDIFLKQNHLHSAINLLRMQIYTEAEKNPKGKRVCGIVGIDKPLVVEYNKQAFMYFADDMIFSQPAHENSFKETFYWAPNFPLISYEMAYQVYMHFKLFPLERQYVLNKVTVQEKDEVRYSIKQNYYRIIKPVIYEQWNMTKFQADKPFQGFKADKDFWFYESPEFSYHKDRWKHYYDSQLSSITGRFCQVDKLGNKTGYIRCVTKLFKLGDF
jgi:hypothetical protein